MEKWTEQQLEAIETRGGSVLVSASAGSGKTSVMIERIIRMVLGGEVSVRNLLVVTFVSTAAAEMKRKLYEALRAAVRENGENARLSAQLNELDLASISTLHSFCADLLRTYFYEAGLDPQFKIISGQDAQVLMGQALDETLEAYYEAEDEQFLALAEIFTRRRRDTAFREMLLSAYEFLCAEADPEGYLARLADSYENPVPLERYLNEYLCSACEGLRSALDKAAGRLGALGLNRHAAIAEGLAADLAAVQQKSRFAENVERLAPLSVPPRAPNAKKDANFLEQAAAEDFARLKKQTAEFAKKFLADFTGQKTGPSPAPHLKKLAEVLSRFTACYAEAKRERNALDFADLEHIALSVLQSERIRSVVRAKYRCVFVDEYQDINGVQEGILEAVGGEGSRFLVGDVKQSIYGFRLCDPAIFTEKYYAYRSGKLPGAAIDLNRNFRSDEGILSFVNRVFCRVCTRRFGGTDYASESLLAAGIRYEHPEPLPAVSVRVVRAQRTEKPVLRGVGVYEVQPEPELASPARAEAELIARTVEEYAGRQIYSPKTGAARPAEYGDIVILTRSVGDYAREVARYLSAAGIPLVGGGDEEGPEVALLIDLLRVIDNPEYDVPLVAVMRSVFGGFSDEELAALRTYEDVRDKKYFYECAFAGEKRADALGAKCAAFFAKIARYRLMSTFSGIARVLQAAMSENGYELYTLSRRNGRERMLRVNAYLNQLETSEIGYSLTGYLAQIDRGGKLELGDTGVAEGNAVRLMTIHKSKGLEFPVVILMGAGQPFNMQDLNRPLLMDKSFGFAADCYDLTARTRTGNPVKSGIRLKRKRETLEEELRVLYVALTRARNHLVVTGRGDPEDWQEGIGLAGLMGTRCYLDFLSPELAAADGAQPYALSVYEPAELEERGGAREAAQAGLYPPDPAFADRVEQTVYWRYPYESEVRARQKLTVTALSASSYEADDTPALPAELFPTDAIDKGLAYHAVLQHADLEDTSLSAIARTVSLLVARGVIACEDLIDLQVVRDCLESPLMAQLKRGELHREKAFMLYLSPRELARGEGEDRVLVQGKIDLLSIQGGRATVVDFKTADIRSARTAAARYGEQLRLYAVAVERVLGLPVERKIVYSLLGRRWFSC